MTRVPTVLVIGLGQEFRTDDALGLEAVRRLRRMALPACFVEAPAADGASLIARWEGYDRVVAIDAVAAGGPPGSVWRVDLSEDNALPARACSTHAWGLAEAVRLARVLGRLPKNIIAFGVEAYDVRQGRGLSLPARQGLRRLVPQVRAEILRLAGTAQTTCEVADA